MTREQVEAMVDAMRNAWEEAATKHPAISFLFEDDAPYLTIWDDNRCKCTHGRILRKVYDVRGHRRTAQAFLLNTLPGESDEEGIDVVNVHAPSGSPKLTDKQRSQLLQNLLQSSSRTRANASIGESKFVIGGDMNTKSMPLGQMLQKLKGQGILKTDVEVMAPLFGQHGDICVVGGFTATLVEERAKNHDPLHIPYGITWRKQPQHATEHLTTTPPVIEDPLEEDALTTTPPGSEHLTTTPRGIKDPLEEDALVTTPPGLEQPIKEAAKRGSSSSSRDLTSSASSHEGQLSQRPLQKDSLSARHASIISKFAPGMKGTFRLVLKNVETKVMAFQFREDVPGLPAEVMDAVERFAQQEPLGPLYLSYRDDEEEKVQEVDPQVKAAEEVDFDEEKAAAMDATERVESSDNATEREEKLRDAEPPTQKEPQEEVGLPKQTQPDPQVVAERDERQPSKLPMEKVPVSKRPAIEQPDDDIERLVDNGDGMLHLLEKKDQRRVVEEASVVQGSPTAIQKGTTHPHEQEAPELKEPGQQMAYVIVNAFLDNVTFVNTEAETLIKQGILRIGKTMETNMLLNIDEVFQPIFFHFPDYPNRTRGQPRDACWYIRQWRDIERWRHSGEKAAAPWYATVKLAKQQVQSILHQYIDNFIRNEADEIQRAQPWNKNKSRAEAVLRKRCGSTMMAKLIWELGLPNVSPPRLAVIDKSLPATEQPRPLPEDVRESMARDTETILNWLSVLATSIHEHKATDKYQEHARKSGTQKHKSGLNEAELKVKEDKKRDARQKYGRQPSTASCSHTWPAPAEWVWVPAQWQRRGDTWQAFAQWQGHGDTWPAPAQWTWHGNKWEALAK